ncbi:MAG: hypothetical protein ACRYFU_08545 [Janthinobacterium lividum]
MILLPIGASDFAQSAIQIHFGDLAGTWTLASIYRTSNVQGPSVAEGKRLLGTHVLYGPHMMSSCGKSVLIGSHEEQEFSEDDLLQDFRGRFSELGVRGKKIEGITMNPEPSAVCFGAFSLPGNVIFVKGKNELIVDFEGVFYRAIRLQ